MSMASRIAVMDHGRIAQLGTPKELYEYPRTRFVADFLGSINFFPGKVTNIDGRVVTVETAQGRFINEADFMPAVGDQVIIGVRPEMLDLDDANPDINRLEGTAQEYSYFGDYNLCLVKLDNGQMIKVFVENDSEGRARIPQFGQRVRVSWSATCGILLKE